MRSSRVVEIYQHIVKKGYLEDRMEYSLEEFQESYMIDLVDARELQQMVHEGNSHYKEF